MNTQCTCKICQKPFNSDTRPSDLKTNHHRGFYCSKECQYKALSQASNKRETRQCKHCGTRYQVRARSKSEFCSFPCFRAYEQAHRLGQTIKCATCGVSVHKQPSMIKNTPHAQNRFCSNECNHVWMKKIRNSLSKDTISAFEMRVAESLQTTYPNKYIHNQDKSTCIGGKFPDFISVKGKVLIEANGCYHHSCPKCFPKGGYQDIKDDSIERRAIFKKYGYKTIFIWEHEPIHNWTRKFA